MTGLRRETCRDVAERVCARLLSGDLASGVTPTEVVCMAVTLRDLGLGSAEREPAWLRRAPLDTGLPSVAQAILAVAGPQTLPLTHPET